MKVGTIWSMVFNGLINGKVLVHVWGAIGWRQGKKRFGYDIEG